MNVRFVFVSFSSSQSSDRLAYQSKNQTADSSISRPSSQHTAYILQPSKNVPNNGNPSSRDRIRDRKQQASLRHGQKSTSTTNTMLDETNQTANHMRSLDRRHQRASPHNSSINSSISKTPNKSSHTDIYGSLERNKHSKVSQPTLNGAVMNGDESTRLNKTDHQAHDFYHLTPTGPQQPVNNTTSTIVNVANALQKQNSFDQIDSIPPPIPPSTHRSRRPIVPSAQSQSVFQPHFDSATSTTPKDSYYTISGAKDVSTHPHQNRSILADNFYNGPPYSTNKPPVAPVHNQQSTMHRYDTSPLLVRRLDQPYPTQTQGPPVPAPRYQAQSYNRTQSSSVMTTSQPTPAMRHQNHTNHIQPSALLFRPQSSQSSSSQSSG